MIHGYLIEMDKHIINHVMIESNSILYYYTDGVGKADIKNEFFLYIRFFSHLRIIQ